MNELVPDNVSVNSKASHASATYNEVKDLLNGILRQNDHPQGADITFSQQAPYNQRHNRHNPSQISELMSLRSYGGAGPSPSPDKRLLSSKFSVDDLASRS